LVAAIICGISGRFPMMGLYIVLAGVFLYSAYAAWKKEKEIFELYANTVYFGNGGYRFVG